MADREVIIITESVRQSWLRDASSVAAFVALIGIGIVLDSTAMQWVGAIIGFLLITQRMSRLVKDNRFTIEEARKRLDEIEETSR
jgi:hypothetical protein